MSNMLYYPNINEKDFKKKLLLHEEFYSLISSLNKEDKIDSEDKRNIYKTQISMMGIIPMNYQYFVSRFISNYTPYKNLLINHYAGSGKTLSVILIIKSNKEFILNNKSFIFIVVPNKLLKLQWNNNIILYIPELINYIKIITYKSLFNKTINLIKEKTNFKNNLLKEENDLNFNNSLIIYEEAHNLTNNTYVEMVEYIKLNFNGIKSIFLTATPIKNKINEIIDLMNFLRDKNEEPFKLNKYLKINDNGDYTIIDEEEIKKSLIGKISFINTENNLYTAKGIYVGNYYNGLKKIKTIKFNPSTLQKKILYLIKDKVNDPLSNIEKIYSALIIPYFNERSNKMIPLSGNKGIELLIKELKENKINYNLKLVKFIKKISNKKDLNNILLSYNEKTKFIDGEFFNLDIIKYFSSKYFYLIHLINKLSGTIFIYSSFVQIGVNIIREILINNGYQDYLNPERGNDYLKKCSICSIKKINHNFNDHEFIPTVFFAINNETSSNLSKLLEIFNDDKNIDGNIIKIIIGSKIVKEGVSFKNIRHVIKLDSSITMGQEEQIIKRGIRLNSHISYYYKNGYLPLVYIYNFLLDVDIKYNEIKNYILSENKYNNIELIYKLFEEIAIDNNVYNKLYTGYSTNKNINTTTKFLFYKNNDIKDLILYINNLLDEMLNVLLDDIYNSFKTQYNELSISLAIKFLEDNGEILLTNIDNKTFIIKIKNTLNKNKLNNILSLSEYNKNYKKYLTTESEILEERKNYIYDFDYLIYNKYYSIKGILKNNFKLQFTNKIIDELGLNLLKKNEKINYKETSIMLLKGWICNQSINKNNIKILMDYFNLENKEIINDNCKLILDYFILLEKYSNDDLHYLIYPLNYENLPFPLNIYDRLKIELIKLENLNFEIIEKKIIDIKINNKSYIKSFNKKNYPFIEINIKAKNKSNDELNNIIIK